MRQHLCNTSVAKDINISRFKLFITELLKSYSIKEDKKAEVAELQKVRKNIGSIITTNYDTFIEDVFEFKSLIGNEILLSNPYGSSYKIHGCIQHPDKIIITDSDYANFEDKYELIRAQLLSLFIHNPIIFLGYNIGDKNIKSILKTIFTYVDLSLQTSRNTKSSCICYGYKKSPKCS
ncbi:SIR2 family protein [Bacillus subtilis]|uniref:SIR2 family NAD-dependent protein deacylase n=1 Tax=Bacillus subtilis TaxID=1423 RepID=UPI000686C5FE|nr:SIR2 family protein [Bacillus subtilis]WBC24894.1 SIR2 family protein [Bacillus subtilis]